MKNQGFIRTPCPRGRSSAVVTVLGELGRCLLSAAKTHCNKGISCDWGWTESNGEIWSISHDKPVAATSLGIVLGSVPAQAGIGNRPQLAKHAGSAFSGGVAHLHAQNCRAEQAPAKT